jgi:LysM repeat protein
LSFNFSKKQAEYYTIIIHSKSILMRKLSLLLVAIFISVCAFSQHLFIRYDEGCMDRYEYRFVEKSNSIAYSAYRTHNAAGDQIFFETGLESPTIRKKVTDKMVDCRNINFDQSTIAEVNSGKRKAYICKKIDSGWAILPVGSMAFMAQHDEMMTYYGSNYELQVHLGISRIPGDKDVTLRLPDEEAKAAMFYMGDIPACDSKAYMFRVSPCKACPCTVDADITLMPNIGLIREKEPTGETFELVTINDVPVCQFLTPNPAPIASSNAQPENISTETASTETPSTSYETTETPVYQASETAAEPNISSKSVDTDIKSVCGIYPMEGEHLVEAGESLYGVARRYGVTVNNLRSWNDMTTDVIQPCTLMKIVAPAKAEQPSMAEAHSNDVPASYDKKIIKRTTECTTVANEGEHVVQQGEGLYAIARKYNVKPSQLHAWNNLASDIIHPCDKLVVVEPVSTPKSIVKAVKRPEPLPKTYAVVVKPKSAKVNAKPKAVVVEKPKTIVAEKRKTLTAAKPKKVVVEKPKMAVVAKPKLTVVTSKSVATTETALTVKKGAGLYVVKKGETIATLADRFDLSETDFRKINNLEKGEKIFSGQVLKTQNCACNVEEDLPKAYNTVVVKPKNLVPKGYSEVVMPKPIKVQEPQVSTKGIKADGEDLRRKYHVVQGDETLFGIARMYGTTVAKLRKVNDLGENEAIRSEQLLILDK